jgi:alkylhydroperoxidase/carboxymuconolactone decarboxylase family protein YurZ
MAKMPCPYEAFKRSHPHVWQAYYRLGALSYQVGPIDKKNRGMVKLAMSIGTGTEGAVHSYTRRAMEDGASPAEIRHLVLLGFTTLGFSSTVASLT